MATSDETPETDELERAAEQAQSRGWIEQLEDGSLQATPLGYQFLDSVVASFL